ncbi:energy-coupling factor transporter transmembrane protein EcfT, partial [Streptomyces sp. SID10853]|nr:energy-coupling factor transporter transmembrane protein EcfT [Streptomyces sp. SID10853]
GPRAWLVAGSGVAVAALMIWAGGRDTAALHPGVVPLVAPVLPLWPAAAVLIGLVPAFVAPVPKAPVPKAPVPKAPAARGRVPKAPVPKAEKEEERA